MYPALSIAFSPCPNDTFIFNALVNGIVNPSGFSLSEIYYEDVETLNQWAINSKIDITKLSFHALGHVLDKYALLSAGSALGRGCGPLVVSRNTKEFSLSDRKTIAIPGKFTTAALLLKMCYPECNQLCEMRFDQIMPAVATGKVDAGVIIHESRFTYAQYGLKMIRDLGAWWEETTGLPIPLGGIAVRKDLGAELVGKIDTAVAQSLEWARSSPEKCTEYIKKYAQETDDEVIASHIKLYVNDYSRNLGADGLDAVREFLDRGNECGAFSGSSSQLNNM